jgi:hypothetical protein
MPRRKILQTNFSAGELSPDLGMRQDTDQYQNGAKSLLNRRVLISGGTVRRPGSWDWDRLDRQSEQSVCDRVQRNADGCVPA